MAKILRLQKSLVSIAIALNTYSFASGLVGVFIPLIILKTGGELWQIPAFYLLYAVIKLTLNYPAVLLIQRRGAHFGLGAAFIAGGVQTVSILGFAATKNIGYLVAGAAALAVANGLLWNSQHVFVSEVMNTADKSSSIATISIIGQFMNVIAPLIGGAVGEYLGSRYLLGFSVVMYLAALVPLRHMRTLARPRPERAIHFNFSGAPRRDILANYFFNIETSVGVMVWPIYLAVYVATFRLVGAITAGAAITTMLATWLAGHRGDKGHEAAVLRDGVAVTSAIDIIRIFATTQFWIALVSTGYRASLAYLQNAWTSIYYHHAKNHGLQYIMSMEIANDLAYVSLWGTLLVTMLTTSTKVFFVVAFSIAAVAAWGCLLITKQK